MGVPKSNRYALSLPGEEVLPGYDRGMFRSNLRQTQMNSSSITEVGRTLGGSSALPEVGRKFRAWNRPSNTVRLWVALSRTGRLYVGANMVICVREVDSHITFPCGLPLNSTEFLRLNINKKPLNTATLLSFLGAHNSSCVEFFIKPEILSTK